MPESEAFFWLLVISATVMTIVLTGIAVFAL
jgi:hypothetical protein